MTCFSPLRVFQEEPGKSVTFVPTREADTPMWIACSQCIGCRLERSRQWATRCIHESQMHEFNSFITLTYDDENLPWDGSLNKKHFQDFMKRLRKKFEPQTIRFFHCGEYGEQLQRPHYHACLFGIDFADRYLWTTRNGVNTYRSPTLEKLWPLGMSTCGELTWETAAYTARYILKKITGDEAEEHYWRPLCTDLEIQVQPEYITMSLKPGIGRTWYEKFKGDCYPSDFITHRGTKYSVPKYYDKLKKAEAPAEYELLQAHRREKAEKHAHDRTTERLAAREQCAIARLGRLPRTYEENKK